MTTNIARKSSFPVADKLIEESKNLTYKPFNIELFGGWEVFSKRLHTEYCSEDSQIFLGWVCPSCKGNDFSLASGLYKEKKHCPDCNCTLESFWSESRTKHRFTQQDFTLGVLAYDNAQLIGFIWGFNKTLPDEKSPGFYMEMVIINEKYRHSKLGISAIFGMVKHIEKNIKTSVYPYVFVRTFKARSLIGKLLEMLGYSPGCSCPEDANRMFFQQYFTSEGH